jgi:hypothetical protein
VQVMKGSADRDRVRAMDELFEQHRGKYRPDVLGLLRAWTGANDYVEVVYFTDEASARAGESAEPPPELAEQMSDMGELLAGVEFIDLQAPRILVA